MRFFGGAEGEQVNAFFTVGREEVQSLCNVSAIDIMSGRYSIRIRNTGITIYDAQNKDTVQEIDLNLTSEALIRYIEESNSG